MILSDIHTHTTYSSDGKSSMEEMVAAAKQLNIEYLGISEHFDYDYKVNGFKFGDKEPTYTDEKKYFAEGRQIQSREKGKFHLLLGCEFGFTPNRAATPLYESLAARYSPDFIVNSVHTNRLGDYYYPASYGEKLKADAYKEYFDLVLRSVKASYPFDIIGHLGYCSRYAPYKDVKILYGEFKEEIDLILKEIIFRGKILEVNTSSRGAGSDFLPDRDILERYFELGGREISFGSDAHQTSRLLDGREKVVSCLKKIGFPGITVPIRGEYLLLPFDEE